MELVNAAAAKIRQAYDDYQANFRSITKRAKTRFEDCDWHGVNADAVERLELYKLIIDRIVMDIKTILGENLCDRTLWNGMKSKYSQMIAEYTDYELSETFFNSVTRRIFHTVGVDPSIEFIDSDFEPRPFLEKSNMISLYECPDLCGINDLIISVLNDHPYLCDYEDLFRDAELVSQALNTRCGNLSALRIEILSPEFYRNFGAYLIGRIVLENGNVLPLALCLRNQGQGVFVDAVLTDEDEVSIVFSFTRSYFHVEVDRPHEIVDFLKTIMPLKRKAELYISIGYNKHGKTELYRDLLNHIEHSTDQFVLARGEKGMVMTVFTMASYDMVFKIIKDRIDPPKTTTRQEVKERYDLVFKHDRAGRLVDAQEFEHLTFERSRFSETLLAELALVAPKVVVISENAVDIEHLYIERRLVPFNLYIKEVNYNSARLAVIDYGQAIKDLAATNIFPGDVLLKNFGVTRHGRVVFYDYDELCLVTDCKFRKMPQARNFEDEFDPDPWFYVGPLDIFPEEFRTFLGFPEPLRSVFIEHHGDLFETDFWKRVQAKHRLGEIVDILAYPEHRKLKRSIEIDPIKSNVVHQS